MRLINEVFLLRTLPPFPPIFPPFTPQLRNPPMMISLSRMHALNPSEQKIRWLLSSLANQVPRERLTQKGMNTPGFVRV